MKTVVILFTLLLSGIALHAQVAPEKQRNSFTIDQFYRGRSHSATIFKASDNLLRKSSFMKRDNWDNQFRTASGRMEKGHGRYANYPLDKPLPLKRGKLYLLAVDDDSTSLFAHSAGIYLGGFRQEKGKPTFVRDGIGIDKTTVTDEKRTTYYIGFYKNNKRHGKGYLVRSDGKMFTAEWKRGRLLHRTKQEFTTEEREKINDYVRKINNLL